MNEAQTACRTSGISRLSEVRANRTEPANPDGSAIDALAKRLHFLYEAAAEINGSLAVTAERLFGVAPEPQDDKVGREIIGRIDGLHGQIDLIDSVLRSVRFQANRLSGL